MLHSITDFEGTREAAGVDAGDAESDDAEQASDEQRDVIKQGSDDDRRGPERTGEHDPEAAETAQSGRTVLGYALLFSLPVGVGVAVMLLQVTRGYPTDPLVFGPSLALAAAVFLLLVAISAGGSVEP